mmetsp:Transcript_5028/g.20539  ORF Transcript_5028/g.20539 Transcript_5028/m.20539 type:complete len:260 (-) Transcript_5028:1164-1943(-)
MRITARTIVALAKPRLRRVASRSDLSPAKAAGSSERSLSLSCSHSQPLALALPDLPAPGFDNPAADTKDRPPSVTVSSISLNSTSASALSALPSSTPVVFTRPIRLAPPRGPVPVTDRYASEGSMNATRNEHVEPVRPKANATLGTYSERVRATRMEPSATPWAKRAATSGATSTTTPEAAASAAAGALAFSFGFSFFSFGFSRLGGLPGVGPPEMGIAADGTKVTYASFALFCRGSKMVGTLARMTSAYPNLIALAPV